MNPRLNPRLANYNPGRSLTAMTVALSRDVEGFLEDQVLAGVCTDASELVNDMLRSLREQQQKSFTVTPELEAWLLEAADKPVTPLTQADFDSLRTRVLARTHPTTP